MRFHHSRWASSERGMGRGGRAAALDGWSEGDRDARRRGGADEDIIVNVGVAKAIHMSGSPFFLLGF